MALLFAFLISAALTRAASLPIDDADIASRLVGTWINDPSDKSEPESTVTYNSDGTGVEVIHLPGQSGSGTVRVTTRWSIKNQILTLKSTESSDPQKIPVGIELKDRIISISDEKFVFETYDGYGGHIGKQSVRLRKK